MSTINLKDDNGIIVTVNKNSCYPVDKDGYITCCLNKFTYFRGKITDEKQNVTEEQIRKNIR